MFQLGCHLIFQAVGGLDFDDFLLQVVLFCCDVADTCLVLLENVVQRLYRHVIITNSVSPLGKHVVRVTLAQIFALSLHLQDRLQLLKLFLDVVGVVG